MQASWAGSGGKTPTTQVQGCRRRLAPTLPRPLSLLRRSRAGEWMLPAALITIGACRGAGQCSSPSGDMNSENIGDQRLEP